MKIQSSLILLTACISPLFVESPVMAQAKPAAGNPVGAMTDDASSSAAKGLDGLSEDKLMSELANRGMESLLNRSFDANKVPENKRAGILSLIALRELSNPEHPLSTRQRQDRVMRIVKGIEDALPQLTDPKILMQQAGTLIKFGVERDVNTLEYWGENPHTQAALRPVVETVVAILDKATAQAKEASDKLANKITRPDDPASAEYEAMENLSLTSAYTRHLVDYYLVLSIDKADPKRNEIIDAAVTFLKEYDTNDSQVQPLVHLHIAKLMLQKGDFATSKKMLTEIAENPKDVIKPKPDTGQQFEARYFLAVQEVLGKNWDEGDKALASLTAWYKENLPKEGGAQEGAAAAVSMLQYRTHVLKSEAATDPAEKAKEKDAAVQVLLVLVKERPELSSIIYEQLMGQLPETPDFKTMDPLLLQAMVRKADQERQKDEKEKIDPKTIKRGIEAARELVGRIGQPGITPDSVDNAALFIPLFYERLNKPVDAANAYMDYAEKFKSNVKNARVALDNARDIIAEQRKNNAEDPAVTTLYERFLPISINPPFNRVEFAFEYARRMQALQDYSKAAQYFALVPTTDKRAFTAKFFRMVALKQALNDDKKKIEGPEREKQLAEIQKLADEVKTTADQGIAKATSDDEKKNFQAIIVKTALLAADIAKREQKNAQRTIDLLANFEDSVHGLPGETALLAEALSLRVNALMSVGRNSDATDALVKLLQATGGNEGATIVYGLLQKINEDLDKAKAANDMKAVQQFAKDRADLSTFLVKWAKENADPKIKKYYYNYAVFDASSKALSAGYEESREARRTGREEALKLYQALLTPENVALYKATLEGTKIDPNYPNPQVLLGIGLLNFDLQNYKEAQKAISQLINDRKLGGPTMVVKRDDQDVVVDNDQYWEALLKMMRSSFELAKANDPDFVASLDGNKTYLRGLYIKWGSSVGGKKWHDDFEALRKEMIPEFDVNQLATPATQPASSQPTTG